MASRSSPNQSSNVWTNSGYAEHTATGVMAEPFEAVTNSISSDQDRMFIRLIIEEY